MPNVNRTVRQMIEMFQWPKCLSKKGPKRCSEKKNRFVLLIQYLVAELVQASWYNHIELFLTFFNKNDRSRCAWTQLSLVKSVSIHRRSQGGGRRPWPPVFRTYPVVLCFERRCPKPNTVARLNSKYFGSPKFWAGYTSVSRQSYAIRSLSLIKKMLTNIISPNPK